MLMFVRWIVCWLVEFCLWWEIFILSTHKQNIKCFLFIYITFIIYFIIYWCFVVFFFSRYNITTLTRIPRKIKIKKRKVVNWIKLSMFLNFPSIQKHKTVILEQQTILCIFIYNIYSLFSITIIKDSEFVCCICGFKEIHKYVIIHWIKIYE